MATVSEVLTAATDSVTLINDVKAGSWNVEGMTQAEINEMVQRNVEHLELMKAKDYWTSESMTAVDSAITAGKGYTA